MVLFIIVIVLGGERLFIFVIFFNYLFDSRNLTWHGSTVLRLTPRIHNPINVTIRNAHLSKWVYDICHICMCCKKINWGTGRTSAQLLRYCEPSLVMVCVGWHAKWHQTQRGNTAPIFPTEPFVWILFNMAFTRLSKQMLCHVEGENWMTLMMNDSAKQGSARKWMLLSGATERETESGRKSASDKEITRHAI